MSEENSISMMRPIRITKATFSTVYTVDVWHVGFPNPEGSFNIVLKIGKRTLGISTFYSWYSAVRFCQRFYKWGLPIEHFTLKGSYHHSNEELLKLIQEEDVSFFVKSNKPKETERK